MTSFFKWRRADKFIGEEPNNARTWRVHGLSEFFGTIMLSLLFAGIGIVVTNSGTKIENYMLNNGLVALYTGFIAIPLLLAIFLRWSCDLNPAITLIRLLKGTNTKKYAFFKIGIQLAGGVVAGLIIFGFGYLANWKPDGSHHTVNTAIDTLRITAYDSSSGFATGGSAFFGNELGIHLNKGGAHAWGFIWITFIEIVQVFFLVWAVFSTQLKDKYRDFFIGVAIAATVAIGLLSGSVSINPARGIAQQVPALFFGHETGGSQTSLSVGLGTGAMLLGTISGPFLFVLMQGVLKTKINPAFTKAIHFKNYRTDNMRVDSQPKKRKSLITTKKINKK